MTTSIVSQPGTKTGRLVSIDASGAGSAGWASDVQGPSAALLDLVSEHAAAAPSEPLVIEVKTSSSNPGLLEEALFQAVRGIAGTAALELGHLGGRVNVIAVNDLTSESDNESTISYLLDEARGGYTTGATIDLRRPPLQRSTTGTVLITGAAGGLGFAAAEAIAATGRQVVLSDRAGEALEAAGQRLGSATIACDLTSPDDLAELAASPLLDDLDAVVVHHGVGASTRFGEDFDTVASSRSLVLNGTTVYDVVELLLPAMRERGGSVVLLSSQAGLTAEEGNGPYCAAKFAVMGYVSTLSERLARHNITVQGLCPGPVDTPLMRAAFAGMAEGLGISADEFTKTRLAAIPLGRAGMPSQIGASTALLVNLQATGVVLAPTGGETLT